MKYNIKKNTLEECLNHWKDPEDHNKSKNYNKEHTQQRSKYLVGIFKKYIDKNSNILEIGCNCCRNLNYLYSAGYYNLTGIEISKKALELKEEFFPNLNCNLINSSIEDYILKIQDNEFDVVFVMAVFQHIHIDSNWIFEHVARISDKYIILIELEIRNYKKIFNKFGFNLIENKKCVKIERIEKYKCKIFKRK